MHLRKAVLVLATVIVSAPANAEMQRKPGDVVGVQRPQTQFICGVAPRPKLSAYCAERCPGSFKCARWKIIS
jgi:hypothetical protein